MVSYRSMILIPGPSTTIQFDIPTQMSSCLKDISMTPPMQPNRRHFLMLLNEAISLSKLTLTIDHFTFGAGRRICSGIHLAENSLFILTGNSWFELFC